MADNIAQMLKEKPKSQLYDDIGFAKIDNHRKLRRGFPEVVFGKGKTTEQIVKISRGIISHDGILLVTHAAVKALFNTIRGSFT